MYVLIVEDDKVQFQSFEKALRESSVISRINRIRTEKEFNDRFEEIALDKPDVILMDIMLRWADPEPDLPPPPPEIDNEGFYRAGLRCERLLARDDRTKNIPIVIYSVLDSGQVGKEIPRRPGVNFLNKTFDLKALERALIDSVRR
jgi:CheY-like chemotaxis protein